MSYLELMDSYVKAIYNVNVKKRYDDPTKRIWWLRRLDFAIPAGHIDILPAQVVRDMLRAGYRPKDTHLLALELPVMTKEGLIEYTPSEEYAKRARTQVANAGRYLNRHFSAPAHVVRDTVAAYVARNSSEITFDINVMLEVIRMENIWSCMCHAGQDLDRHPYQCYQPKYGWGMAIRRKDGRIIARGLVHVNKETGYKCFVRTYTEGRGQRGTDTELNAWLEEQGYEYADGWPIGTRLASPAYSTRLEVAPYLDGYNQWVIRTKDDEGFTVYEIQEKGYENEMWELDSQNGYIDPDVPTAQEEPWVCPHCGTAHRADDRDDVIRYHGYDQEDEHCSECEEAFTEVVGRRGRTYLVHRDDVITTVEGSDFHDSYTSENDIVELDYGMYRGEWTHVDNTITDVDGNHWHEDDQVTDIDDSGIIMLSHMSNDSGWIDTDDAYKCHYDNEIYSKAVDEYTTKSVDGDIVYVNDDNLEDWEAEHEAPNDEEAAEAADA